MPDWGAAALSRHVTDVVPPGRTADAVVLPAVAVLSGHEPLGVVLPARCLMLLCCLHEAVGMHVLAASNAAAPLSCKGRLARVQAYQGNAVRRLWTSWWTLTPL